MNTDLTSRAYLFARATHAAVGQKRKYTGEDYIQHPIEVANIIWRRGCNTEMIAAAYLHDVVEDTQVSISLIREEFGKCIATLVEGLTETHNLTSTVARRHTIR